MRIGIMSTAHMHAHAYLDGLKKVNGVELVGVYDDQVSRGRTVANQHGVPFFDDAESMLKTCDAAIVCSENANHKRDVLRAAAAKVHILCEKPIATRAEDASEMVRACQGNHVHLFMAMPVRCVASIRALRNVVQSGDLGEVVAMRGTNHGYMPGGWFVDKTLSGGGAVMDHTVHVADIMRWIAGSEVAQVYAEVDERIHHKGIDDCGILSIRFENGVFATLDPSWSRTDAYPTWGDVTLEVVGTRGTAAVDAFAQHINVYSTLDGKGTQHFYGDNMDDYLVREFLRALNGEPVLLATGIDGLRALEVASAAYQSAHEKQAVKLARASV